MPTDPSLEVLVIGAGPAGLAAACRAAECGARAAVADDNPGLGGQIWRGETERPDDPEAAAWLERARQCRIRFIPGAAVVGQTGPGLLLAACGEKPIELRWERLILATGARERFLPFPGWTLPGVFGAGGLQALAKSGLPVEGRRVVVAGSGPLLLAVAAYLRKRGAEVLLISEQASRTSLLRFLARLAARHPRKLLQAIELKRRLRGVRYAFGSWPVRAEGVGKLERVTFAGGGRTWTVECDFFACGFGLVPNLELPALLGCAIENGIVRVDALQRTSVEKVFCAGEAAGIGGLDLALATGQIAGCAAAGRPDRARRLFPARKKARRFAAALERAFALREELRRLAEPGTLVCRCEDVPFESLSEHSSWRAAKLATRCGMGPCQGRVCGAAAEFLFGWRVESIRPPIFPCPIGHLALRQEEAAGEG